MYAFIPSGRVPTRDEWQHALDTLDMAGITLSLYPLLDVGRASGFCPMILSGVAAGVEVYINSPPIRDFATMIEELPVLAGRVTPEHTAISFRMGPRLSELVCANAACAGLVSGFGAVVWVEADGEVYSSPERLIIEARLASMWDEYGSDKKATPEFAAELERVNGGPLPRYTITLERTPPPDLDYLWSLVRPKE